MRETTQPVILTKKMSDSDLSDQDAFVERLEPPEEARRLGEPGPSILLNSSNSYKPYNPNHERNYKDSPRKLSMDSSISFAPLPQRPASLPRRNSITLGVAARSNFFNGKGTSVHKNPDGSMVKVMTAEEWKELDRSQGRTAVDLGDVAVDAGKKVFNFFRNKKSSKSKDSGLDDVGEEPISEASDETQPSTALSQVSTEDTRSVKTPPTDIQGLQTNSSSDTVFNHNSFSTPNVNDNHNYKTHALGFDPNLIGDHVQDQFR